MAAGDITIFDEALVYLSPAGGWNPTDIVKCAILDNTTTPAETDTTPALGDYTEVGTAGSYVAGGQSLGDFATIVSETGGVLKYDSATNPSWAKHASNDTDAYWGLLYNDTQVGDPAFAFVDLGGPVDMTAGPLTITWHADGIITAS